MKDYNAFAEIHYLLKGTRDFQDRLRKSIIQFIDQFKDSGVFVKKNCCGGIKKIIVGTIEGFEKIDDDYNFFSLTIRNALSDKLEQISIGDIENIEFILE